MSDKIVVLKANGNTQHCQYPNCYNWVFLKQGDEARCPECLTKHVLVDGETLGTFPRPGREYWDRINQLPTYSFWNVDGAVKRVPDNTGKWFEADDVRALMDEAQDEMNQLRARLAQLEPKGVIDE